MSTTKVEGMSLKAFKKICAGAGAKTNDQEKILKNWTRKTLTSSHFWPRDLNRIICAYSSVFFIHTRDYRIKDIEKYKQAFPIFVFMCTASSLASLFYDMKKGCRYSGSRENYEFHDVKLCLSGAVNLIKNAVSNRSHKRGFFLKLFKGEGNIFYYITNLKLNKKSYLSFIPKAEWNGKDYLERNYLKKTFTNYEIKSFFIDKKSPHKEEFSNELSIKFGFTDSITLLLECSEKRMNPRYTSYMDRYHRARATYELKCMRDGTFWTLSLHETIFPAEKGRKMTLFTDKEGVRSSGNCDYSYNFEASFEEEEGSEKRRFLCTTQNSTKKPIEATGGPIPGGYKECTFETALRHIRNGGVYGHKILDAARQF